MNIFESKKFNNGFYNNKLILYVVQYMNANLSQSKLKVSSSLKLTFDKLLKVNLTERFQRKHKMVLGTGK